MNQIQLNQYLQRVGLSSQPNHDPTALFELHGAQFFTIPFENLDIQLRRPISLDPNHLFDKLVLRKRGGYCFELNGLMFRALQVLGFNVRPLLARVHLTDPPSGLTHMVNLVSLQGQQWLMDVGFGAGGPRQPLLLTEGEVESTADSAYRLGQTDPWGWMLQTREGDEWKNSYSLDLGFITPQDIQVGNFYTSHSPDSHFAFTRVVSIPTEQGRKSIRNLDFTEINAHGEVSKTLRDDDTYLEFIHDHFGIRLNADYDEFLPLYLNA